MHTEVLEFFANYALSMQTAKTAGKSSVEIAGETFLCCDRPRMLFATFNPGYAGRVIMSQNSACRKIMMYTPPYEMIIDVMLATSGFKNSRVQGELINNCFKAFGTQLTKN